MVERPGGGLAKRPLHLFWLADCSGSMQIDGKVQALNNAIREAIPHVQDVARSNPHAQVMVRALAFSNGVRWHIADPTPVEQLSWTDLHADGLTDLGAALRELATQLRMPPLEARALPPAVVLVSDGQPTDDWRGGLAELMSEPWGRKAVRLAIAIGRDADYNVLDQFIGHPEIQPVTANTPERLAQFFRWASTVAVGAASVPRHSEQETPVPIPPPPEAPTPSRPASGQLPGGLETW